MTPQEQKNRLNDLFFHAQRCALYDDQHREYSHLGLGITLYFYGTGSAKGQQKVLDVFTKYKEQYGQYLNGLFLEKFHRRFIKFTDKKFDEYVEKSKNLYKEDSRLSFVMGSDRKGDYADAYQCETLTTDLIGETEYNFLSYLHLVFPFEWLKSEDKRQEFEDWLSYLCSEFDIFHGHAGLECILPYDFDEWAPHEYQVATHYYNVMPNCTAYAGIREYKTGIKSIAWYTILGKELLARLDQATLTRLTTQYPEIRLLNSDQGSCIIKIDDLPDMGDPSEPLLLSYQALNEALKPIRVATPNRLHGLYNVPHFDAVKTFYWSCRWDNPNMKDGVLDNNGTAVKTAPILVEGDDDDIVPYSGKWQPYNHKGEIIHLEKGVFFPGVEKPEDLRASTLWRLISRDDGGELFVLPSFK